MPMHQPTLLSGQLFNELCFMFCMMMSGLPAQPVPVTIQDITIIIGETKASELLDQGFSFEDKSPESSITNPKTTTSTTVSFSKSSGMISPMAL